MPLYRFADLVEPAFAVFRRLIEAELARLDLPTDRDSVTGLCRALACLVQDPHGVILASKPAPFATYAGVADAIRTVEEAFPALVVALRGFVAELERDPQLQAWWEPAVRAGALRPADVPQAMRRELLRVLADMDEEA